MAIAQSVFTHVSINHMRLCLYRAAKVVKPGGSFYATFFERAKSTPVDHIISAHKEKPFYTEKNVFWYYRERPGVGGGDRAVEGEVHRRLGTPGEPEDDAVHPAH